MAKNQKPLFVGAVILPLFCLTCNAPHKNPLDPMNGNPRWTSLYGVVRSSAASQALHDVVVVWERSQMTTTDVDGSYKFDRIRPANGWLLFQKTGFLTDSVFVEWNGRQTVEQNMTLRQEPALRGRVQTVRVPPAAIADVKVTWQPAQQYTFTDAAGYYSFARPLPSDGLLIFEKDGYRTAEILVEWTTGADVTKDVFLNANPRLEDFSLFSIVTNYYEPRAPTHELVARARLGDAEGDIDSVYIECAALAIKAYLQYDVLERVFERSFSAPDLQVMSLRQVVGFDFNLCVVDRFDYRFNLGQERLARVITDEIVIDSPNNSESVPKNVVLKWLHFDPGFKFTFHVKIHTDDDFTPDLVWERSGIAADADSVNAYVARASDYVWEIWCVDEFDNRARSKQGSFRVIN